MDSTLPVCGDDLVLFPSACHAGCTTALLNKVNIIERRCSQERGVGAKEIYLGSPFNFKGEPIRMKNRKNSLPIDVCVCVWCGCVCGGWGGVRRWGGDPKSTSLNRSMF